jgi:tripartite ATP-independent transporter DctM subunit
MAYINVANSMVMGGVSGTAVSDVASLGRIEIQVMKSAGYPASYAAALTASTAVIAPIIPPSVAMIIYALAAGGVSIGGLFMAGVVPGLIMGLGLWVMAWFKSRHAGFGHRVDRPGARVLARQTLRVFPFLFLPVIIVGGIIGGIFTVTESAAVGVAYVLIIGFATRSLSLKDVYETVIYSSIISSVVGLLMGTGAILSWILTRNQVTQELAEFLATLTTDPTLFMIIVAVALLALGTIMDVTAMMIALAPLLVPIARQYGIPDLQFGLVFVMSCMVGMITPPVGILLFMTASLAEIPLEDVYAAILPFVIASFVLIGVLIVFPPLTLWVPSLFGFR